MDSFPLQLKSLETENVVTIVFPHEVTGTDVKTILTDKEDMRDIAEWRELGFSNDVKILIQYDNGKFLFPVVQNLHVVQAVFQFRLREGKTVIDFAVWVVKDVSVIRHLAAGFYDLLEVIRYFLECDGRQISAGCRHLFNRSRGRGNPVKLVFTRERIDEILPVVCHAIRQVRHVVVVIFRGNLSLGMKHGESFDFSGKRVHDHGRRAFFNPTVGA